MTFRSSERCEDALDLAEGGYSVFPCHPRGKAPLTANGFKAATCDERRILLWWDRWPDANIGVACEASGVTVVDVDTKAGADPIAVFAELAKLGDPAALVVSWTGRAPEPTAECPDSLADTLGAHIWFGGVTRTGHTRWPGVELRSRGAYVIAPHSTHPSGVQYQWRTGSPFPVGQLPALPDAFQDGGEVRGNGQDWRTPPAPDEPLPVSERHDGLLCLAGSLLARHVYEPDLLTGALLEANRVRCRPPKGEREVRALARWAVTSEAATAGRFEQELARRLFRAWRAEDGTP